MTATKGSNKESKDVSKKDVFQAVLLADNFENYIFGENCPFVPEGLISLNNRKVIDYSLEALISSGVHEIFVYSTRNTAELKDHIKNSKWSSLGSTINVVSSEDSQTLGDAMRDLDAKALVRNDFILVQAGVITNIALRPLLDKFRETVKQDKGAVMTLVHRKMSLGHRSRPRNVNHIVTVDSRSGKIISYNFKLSGKKLSIPLESIQQPEMDLYLDTVDTGIAVCSSCVLPLFTDNFDFTNMNDFIRGILINEEIMGISLDILQRWSYPLVPDMPLGAGQSSIYPFNYNFTYKGNNVKIDHGAEVGPLVIIGHNVEVGKSSSVVNSSLGDKCKVGQHVKITNSFIGDNVTIEDDCEIHEAVIAGNTTILKGTELKPWVLVEGKTQSRIALPNAEDDDESDSDSDIVPAGGQEGSDYEIDDDAAPGGIQDDDFIKFSGEVLDSLQRGFEENVATENLVLEINSSKYAYNISFKEVTVALTKGVLTLVVNLNPGFQEVALKTQWAKQKETILKFKDLFQHYIKTEESQRDLLNALEEYANDHLYYQPMLMQTLHCLYDDDILTEEAVLEWHSSESLYAAGKKLRSLVQQFVSWLENAESEEDSD
ncbi:unnamed protein product [Allacma fusca]|uniref:Translation initiation factor eIF2B subunit epsilon n=1 Tax=Allacma fusca TaxID=39272 RepID=A0A8J2LMR6_9HEXA|nr:unnamed protein product [Allacma fusca]